MFSNSLNLKLNLIPVNYFVIITSKQDLVNRHFTGIIIDNRTNTSLKPKLNDILLELYNRQPELEPNQYNN